MSRVMLILPGVLAWLCRGIGGAEELYPLVPAMFPGREPPPGRVERVLPPEGQPVTVVLVMLCSKGETCEELFCPHEEICPYDDWPVGGTPS